MMTLSVAITICRSRSRFKQDQSTDMDHVAQKQTVNQGVQMPSTVEEVSKIEGEVRCANR
jgi:hypothetical protein